METWDDYWHKFESLVLSLRTSEKQTIIDELRDAQKYVNGMTDGWYDFKSKIETILMTNRTQMTKEQVDALAELATTLNDMLTRR